MLCALGVVLVYLGAITDILDLSLCAVVCLIVIFARIEVGKGFAYLVYAASALLSLVLCPQKFSAAAYAFMALYAVLKADIERLGRLLSWILKLAYFNLALTGAICAAKYLFAVPDLGSVPVWFVLGNVTFVLFDIALTKLITLYIIKFRQRLKIDKFLRKL